MSDETNGTLCKLGMFCSECYISHIKNWTHHSEGFLKSAKDQIENLKKRVWKPFDSAVEVADWSVCCELVSESNGLNFPTVEYR